MIKKITLLAVLLPVGLIQAMERAVATAGRARSESQGSPRAPRQEARKSFVTPEQNTRELIRLAEVFVLHNEINALDQIDALVLAGADPEMKFFRRCGFADCAREHNHGSYTCLSMLEDFDIHMRNCQQVKLRSNRGPNGETQWDTGIVEESAQRLQVPAHEVVRNLEFWESATEKGAQIRLAQVKRLVDVSRQAEAVGRAGGRNPVNGNVAGGNNSGRPNNNPPSSNKGGSWSGWFSCRNAAAVVGLVIVAAIVGKKYYQQEETKK